MILLRQGDLKQIDGTSNVCLKFLFLFLLRALERSDVSLFIIVRTVERGVTGLSFREDLSQDI